MAVASWGEEHNTRFERAAWRWVDAPNMLEDEGLLKRLRANNHALESLRAALDAETVSCHGPVAVSICDSQS
ncbi:hypothetical protein LQ948_05410 [Jiella sp. MQZ9-1]|uniref:Uncharacterized protein n=1 Tax=Jiella flava TaxID=2816857 RepID=A0A939JTE1_9HYPH|nr:hypothetical protein [Jiella flava]MBO0662030.1 hypothetical protein [Jiella flava]MCD2470643.1 hypothetical protein [Jiella flava]